MSEDLVQATSEIHVPQCDHPGAEFKAKARKIALAILDGHANSDVYPMEIIIPVATALAEAYARGLQDGAGRQDALIVKRLTEWFEDPENGSFENEDFQAIMRDVGRWDAPQMAQDGSEAPGATITPGDTTPAV